ncbi:MAG: hypothetical protein NC181_04880 [Clostridium sp.]|nr:hypothetical protein [Clostridium sp.]MCM1444569.1 hypothetical protein [Candidatus Amulumruptor caecigallinarius]
MLSLIKKNKKIILIVTSVLLLPFMMALLHIITEIIFEGGKIVGNFIRTYTSSCII